MNKPNGSDIFGTTVVRTDEYILLASVMVQNGSSVPRADSDIMAIDDMLSIQRIQSIVRSKRYTATGRLRKDSSLLDIYSKRIDLLLEQQKELE